VQFLFAQVISDTSQDVLVTVGIGINFKKLRDDKIRTYADSLNNYRTGKLPDFLFDECIDWHKSFWESLHSAVSVRWIILEKVYCKQALKAILDSQDKRLKKVCDHQCDKIYPYLAVPMIEKSFYQLVTKRYKQL